LIRFFLNKSYQLGSTVTKYNYWTQIYFKKKNNLKVLKSKLPWSLTCRLYDYFCIFRKYKSYFSLFSKNFDLFLKVQFEFLIYTYKNILSLLKEVVNVFLFELKWYLKKAEVDIFWFKDFDAIKITTKVVISQSANFSYFYNQVVLDDELWSPENNLTYSANFAKRYIYYRMV